MLRLHHAPMACSLASRLALLETGLPHEVMFVDTQGGEQRTEAYRRINPRGQVPALETPEGVLTESAAILPYIADQAPQTRLFPPHGGFARAQAQAWLCWLSSSLHPAARAVMFPARGCDTAEARAGALQRLAVAFAEVDARLAGRDHLLDAFSVCDIYLFVFGLWRAAPALVGELPPSPDLDRFQERMLDRPGYGAIVAQEMQLRSAHSSPSKVPTS